MSWSLSFNLKDPEGLRSSGHLDTLMLIPKKLAAGMYLITNKSIIGRNSQGMVHIYIHQFIQQSVNVTIRVLILIGSDSLEKQTHIQRITLWRGDGYH